MEKGAKKEFTVEMKIAATVTRYVVACIMRKQRLEELERWSRRQLVHYFLNNTTLQQEIGHDGLSKTRLQTMQKASLIDLIADYDVNTEDLRTELGELGIEASELDPFIGLHEVLTNK